jgi:hypothetical protein
MTVKQKSAGACAREQGGKGEEEWKVRACMKEGSKSRPAQMEKRSVEHVHREDESPQRPRTSSTSRSTGNCARKRGALESCVARWKYIRVDVRMKEQAPAMRVRHQRELLEKGKRAAAGEMVGRHGEPCMHASIVAGVRMHAQHT